jgi:hypothetical protein
MRKEISYIIIGIFLISLVSAASFGTYKRSSCVELMQICSNCSYNNISKILYPNSSIAVENVAMTKDDTYYNYTFCLTNVNGNYIVNGYGDIDGEKTSWNYDFAITPSGNPLDTSSAITYGLVLIIMFGATIFFLLFASLTESPGVKLFFNIIGYLAMFLTVSSGYILLQNSGISSMDNTVRALLYILGIVLIIIMFYIMINQTRHVLALMRAKKGFGSEHDNPPIF